jgi:hypothetical protein
MTPVLAVALVVFGGFFGIAVHHHLYPAWRTADMLHQFLLPVFIAGGMLSGLLFLLVVAGLFAVAGLAARVAKSTAPRPTPTPAPVVPDWSVVDGWLKDGAA